MKRPTSYRRLRYWFDNTMSRGTPALVGWLALVSLTLVVVLSALMVTVDGRRASVGTSTHEIWKNTVETFHLGDATSGGLVYRALVVALALAGLFFASALISLLTSGVDRKIAELRKGRSLVIERDHTVLIGWSEQIFPMISELAEANASRRGGCVAVLADRDRVEMEEEIRRVVGRTGRTRVVCRTGNPIDPGDLDIVGPQTARSVVVLSPAGDTPDAQVIKTLLALTNSPTRRPGRYHIVAAVRDARNRAAAQLAGGTETVLVDADDIAARLIVQTCRQSGLSVVYQDLLDFAGDEIYMAAEPALAGRAFGEALHAYPASSVIGLHRADGRIELCPPMDAVVGAGDEIIAISADDDTLLVDPWDGFVAEEAFEAVPERAARPTRTLMLGWNRRSAGIARRLDGYVTAGSVLDVVADDPDAKAGLDALRPGLERLEVTFELGDTDERAPLEALDIASYDNVIVLCYDGPDAQYADSRALITLLHLRQMQAETGRRYSIVSEMSDDRNRRLAQVTKADDFIVSDKLLSLLMVQLSENRHLAEVFAELFDPAGAEIYLRPATDYVLPDVEIDFHTVVEAAARRGDIAIGYRVGARTAEPPAFGVVLNPAKAARRAFAAEDRVIVLTRTRDAG
ncbi:CASTOR/POLLUX-related putative ion channel [Actinomadura parmotrematis]|uniref:Potassium transporter TrkA n=1 Tax=Actinomadura parmotrematis TaxID=2864039 RepID=A0ABS7G2Y0_9ACTN|nr:potassium transporter TrkA [Actinomadura parmotrematis]MBW8486555.1 potassium transporter TrkA [Actinomadura parmotrematis]